MEFFMMLIPFGLLMLFLSVMTDGDMCFYIGLACIIIMLVLIVLAVPYSVLI